MSSPAPPKRIGFPVNIHVLFYGDHPDLAERVLGSLFENTPPELFTLTLGLNAVSPATREVIEHYVAQKADVRIVESAKNIFKCPMMRKMFEAGDDRPWTLWFDDDSYVTDPGWLQSLAAKIEEQPEHVIFGKLYFIDISSAEAEIMRESAWYKNIPFQIPEKGSKLSRISFPTGGVWGIETRVLQELGWPDPSLKQTRDDYVLGEALRQHGYTFGAFEEGISISEAPSRAAEQRILEAREVGSLGFE